MERVISFVGLLTMVAIAFLLSSDRKRINWKTVGVGIGLQMMLGLFILKTGIGKELFAGAKDALSHILSYADQGIEFVFGSLADSKKVGFVIFTMVLPIIIFVSALMSVLYHLGVMQIIIKGFAWVMFRLMGTSGAESLAAAANVFVGQTEAPLVIRHYISKMTESELLALMTGGMATVAGSVLAAYVGMGIDGGHLLAASVMSAPAALVCAKLMIPETKKSLTSGKVKMSLEKNTVNVIDAAARGASDGLTLAINVGAMLIAFIALIALINGAIGAIGGLFGHPGLSMELIVGYLFSPLAFLMGIPWADSLTVGSLLGKKMILNEFVAYLDLQKLIEAGKISERSVAISTYALCGFANFGSIAIQIAGIEVLAPNRRKDLARLGIRALIGGTLACMMSASIAGLLI